MWSFRKEKTCHFEIYETLKNKFTYFLNLGNAFT